MRRYSPVLSYARGNRMSSPRPELVVDERGRRVGAPDGSTIGIPGPLPGRRVIWAFPTNAPGGGPSRRYSPPFPPNDFVTIGIDMSFVIPLGADVASATLSIFTNTASPAPSTDFTLGLITIEGRSVYATLTGGVSGQDYQLRWNVNDSLGNQWQRTGLLLCALTS